MFEMMTLASAEEVVPMGMLAVGVVWILASHTRSIAKAKQLEESRREIAAYVAEGTISPDDAVRLLNAGRPAHEVAKAERA